VRRIVVVGSTGSGKTTLARDLAQRLGISHVELDALNWGPNWTPVDPEVFRERARELAARDAWVTDGNYYTQLGAILWARADTVIWLDYPLHVIFWRLLRRTTRRVLTQEELWSGNRERLSHQFSRDSLFLWAFQSVPMHRERYPQEMTAPENAHLTFHRFRSPRETARWLATVKAEADVTARC
jgi:adenylate kinase family enzyme